MREREEGGDRKRVNRSYVLTGARRRRDATRASEKERNGGAQGGEEKRGCSVSYGCGKVGIRVKHVSTCVLCGLMFFLILVGKKQTLLRQQANRQERSEEGGTKRRASKRRLFYRLLFFCFFSAPLRCSYCKFALDPF